MFKSESPHATAKVPPSSSVRISFTIELQLAKAEEALKTGTKKSDMWNEKFRRHQSSHIHQQLTFIGSRAFEKKPILILLRLLIDVCAQRAHPPSLFVEASETYKRKQDSTLNSYKTARHSTSRKLGSVPSDKNFQFFKQTAFVVISSERPRGIGK